MDLLTKMRIIVSDSSCLIDMHLGGLLGPMFDLPYSFSIVDTLFEDELLSLSDDEKYMLLEKGLDVVELSGAQVQQAFSHKHSNPALTPNDCFTLVLSEILDDAILFTGDARLKRLAEQRGIETHGVLWALDQLSTETSCPHRLLRIAIERFIDDPLVFLPGSELNSRLRKLLL